MLLPLLLAYISQAATYNPSPCSAGSCKHTVVKLLACIIKLPLTPQALAVLGLASTGEEGTSKPWPSRGREMCSWCGGFAYSAEHVAFALMSSPRLLKGVATTVGQGSPSAGSRKPHMPPAHKHAFNTLYSSPDSDTVLSDRALQAWGAMLTSETQRRSSVCLTK